MLILGKAWMLDYACKGLPLSSTNPSPLARPSRSPRISFGLGLDRRRGGRFVGRLAVVLLSIHATAQVSPSLAVFSQIHGVRCLSNPSTYPQVVKCKNVSTHRGVEQLAARQPHKLEVAGSSPAPVTAPCGFPRPQGSTPVAAQVSPRLPAPARFRAPHRRAA